MLTRADEDTEKKHLLFTASVMYNFFWISLKKIQSKLTLIFMFLKRD